MKIKIIILFALIMVASCNSEDDPSIYVRANDVNVNMDENPEKNKVISRVNAHTNHGTLTYSIHSQVPEGALTIDVVLGELSVKNETLFDFETNPIITAVIEVSNGMSFDLAKVTIHLRNVKELEEFQLSKFTEDYLDTAGQLQVRYESDFMEDKIISRFKFDKDNTLLTEIKYYYDNNLLQKEELYGNGILQSEKIIMYDSFDRIVKISYQFFEKTYNNYTDAFSFPDENTILAITTNSYGHVFEKKYYLNDDGLVIEEFQEDVITAVTYNDVNPVLKVDQVSNIYYSYLENSLNPLVIYHQILGAQKFNFVLYHNDLDAASDIFAGQLIKEKDFQNEESFKEINEYEMNHVGLPISSKKYFEEAGVKRLTAEFYYAYE